ncbi:hypothetical protein CL617_04920 [archaeon]|nr:hypothetical protein [archaeon]|tara:strand:- start:1894 stop:2358 length:465 start_codon:yes stop_codon:yes gene_type:complete
MVKQKKVKWGRPDKFEILLLLAYGLFLYLFNDMVNLMSNDPLLFKATGQIISGLSIPIIGILWVSLILFHVSLFGLVSRSIWKRGTTHKYIDMGVGMWMFIGVFAVIISTVVMLSGRPPEYEIPWLFGVGRITLYHAGLFLFQIPGMVYFAITK